MKHAEDRQEIAHLAHDVRGLLACVQLEICTLSGHEDEFVRRKARMLERATDRLVDYCAAAIADAVADKRNPESVDAESVMAEAALFLSAEAPTTQVAVSLTKAPNIQLSKPVANALHRMMINLGRNAIQAMRRRKDACLQIRAESNQKYLVVDIIDNGPGLPESALDCFFHKKDNENFRNRTTGIGLNSTRRLASEIGGDLILLKSDQRGAAFRIKIPHGMIRQNLRASGLPSLIASLKQTATRSLS